MVRTKSNSHSDLNSGDLFDLLIFGERELDWKNKVKIALQVAQACFYLHSKGTLKLSIT